MAQWDERDPRWLVEDRKDGTNVSGWHWSERNALQWTKEDLATRLLVEAALPDGGVARVTKVASVEGEASISTRKGGKKFAAYDLTLSLDWEVVGSGDGGGGGGGGGGDSSTTPPLSACSTGSMKLSEVATGHDGEDDILFEAGAGPPDAGAAVIRALKPGLVGALAAYAAALDALEV